MSTEWHIRQQLEFLSSPTTVQYHRIDTYSSIVEGVRRVRRILSGDHQGDERLIQACCRNDIETVKWLLDNDEKSPINLRRGLNRSVLHEAVLHHNGRALARLLCQYGADPKQRDSLGRTPIHYAASCGHLDILLDLIHFSRVSVSELLDTEGRCALMYACGEGHLTICKDLIQYENADYQRKDDRGRACLSYACRSGHIEIVQYLLTISSPEPTTNGWYPMHFACAAGHLDIVRILLEYDPKSGHVLTTTDHSALFMAMHATENSKEMVKCLLNSNSSVRLTSKDIEDLYCDKSLIILLAQHRHSLEYLLDIIEKLNYPLILIHLLLLSEHSYSSERLLSITQHQSIIRHYQQNTLKLKQITRCLIRKSIDTSQKIDRLQITVNLKKFLHFEFL